MSDDTTAALAAMAAKILGMAMITGREVRIWMERDDDRKKTTWFAGLYRRGGAEQQTVISSPSAAEAVDQLHDSLWGGTEAT